MSVFLIAASILTNTFAVAQAEYIHFSRLPNVHHHMYEGTYTLYSNTSLQKQMFLLLFV